MDNEVDSDVEREATNTEALVAKRVIEEDKVAIRKLAGPAGTSTKRVPVPDVRLSLTHVHGYVPHPLHCLTVASVAPTAIDCGIDYHGTIIGWFRVGVSRYRGYDCRNNVSFTATDDIVYHIAAVGIVMERGTKEQRFYTKHTDDILCLAGRPVGEEIATGQITGSGDSAIHVWNSQSMATLSILSTKVGPTFCTPSLGALSKHSAQHPSARDTPHTDHTLAEVVMCVSPSVDPYLLAVTLAPGNTQARGLRPRFFTRWEEVDFDWTGRRSYDHLMGLAKGNKARFFPGPSGPNLLHQVATACQGCRRHGGSPPHQVLGAGWQWIHGQERCVWQGRKVGHDALDRVWGEW